MYEHSQKIPLPSGHYIDHAELVTRYIPPTEEERKRGEFRQDIQRALTSVEMPGGLFGTPRPVYAARDVGARGHHEHYIMCYKSFPHTYLVNGDQIPARKFTVRLPAYWYDVRVAGEPEEMQRAERELQLSLQEAEDELRKAVKDHTETSYRVVGYDD